jgi:glycosyltransferase involved in cell wall biosynthesis
VTRTLLFLTTSLDVGGAERVLIQAAAALRAHGFEVLVAAFEGRGGQVARELSASGVTVIDLRISRHVALWAIPNVVRLLRECRVSVIYTFLIHAHLVGRLAGRLAGTPVVLSSQQVMGWEGRLADWLNRVTSRWCTRVVAVSSNVADYLVRIGVPRNKVVVIYNCVDVAGFSCEASAASAAGLIGSVARLSPEKDHATLLRALALVRKTYPDVRLVLAGDGPERPRLESLAGDLGVASAVEFLGQVADVRPLLSSIDVFVQSSHVEGLPVAVLEALAACRPVIATDVGGNREAVVDGECGYLVPPSHPEALAAAIARVLADPVGAAAMGRRGRQHVQAQFGREAMVRRTLALLYDLGVPPVDALH